MLRKDIAMQNFTKGYNCCQSVLLAFADLLPYDEITLVKLASSFGGGMGRLREVCGAVTGMFIVAGFLYGYDSPDDIQSKSEHYALIQKLAKAFEEQTGTIICRELLRLEDKADSPAPSERTADYYKTRPCCKFVGIAAEILEKYIEEN